MKKFILTIGFLGLFFTAAHAQNGISVLGDNPIPKDESQNISKDPLAANEPKPALNVLPNSSEVSATDPFETMRVQFEAKRNKEFQIKLLDLELEKKQRELKGLEVQAKINELKDDSNSKNLIPLNTDLSAKQIQESENNLKINLIYLINSNKYKEALLKINGTNYAAHEGDTIAADVTILKISKNCVLIKEPKGESTIYLSAVRE